MARHEASRTGNPFIRRAAFIGTFVIIAILGFVTGVYFAYSPDLPIISDLDDYTPGTITRIHARTGELIGEFATERRLILSYDEIPEVLRNAIIAAEDGDFFTHTGFNIPRIVITMLSNILEGDLTAAGASTITMQLARNVTLRGESLGLEKTWQRKLREAYYAFHIEKRYTKREIFTLYANQMWLGTLTHSAYGVEAASLLYFGKLARDLDLGEAAMIAGIHQTPARQSPLVNMALARSRRNYALQRMADEGYVTQAEADEAKAQPTTLAERTVRSNSIAPYFIELVRQHLEQEYGVAALYEEGLTVHTTLDVTLQEAANKAVQAGLRVHDKRHGFRPPARNILQAAAADASDDREPADVLATFGHSRWIFAMNVGDIVPAVVTAVDREAMQVRFGPYAARVVPKGLRVLSSGLTEGFRGIGRTPADQLVQPGDLIEVKITALDTTDADGNELEETFVEAELEQEPLAEAAVVAIENRTGRILAMVGGYSFDRSKFNRATQAHRQLGSLFKGVLYAAAIDQGYTTTSIVQDEPTSYDVGPEQDLYEPTNYDNTYEGPITPSPSPGKITQCPRRLDDERSRPGNGGGLRPTTGVQLPDSTVPLGRARFSRSDVAGGDQRVLCVPEPGGSHDPVSDRPHPRPRRYDPRRKPAGTPRRDPRRHRLYHGQPDARRRRAWHRYSGKQAGLATRRQDRHDGRLYRRVVRRVRPRDHGRCVGRLR